MSSKIKRLLDHYSTHIAVPWRDQAAAQRVIFCVYSEDDELRLRSRVDEFEIVTREAGHNWELFDLTDSFAEWMSSQRYAKKYFSNPDLISTLLPKYEKYVVEAFNAFADKKNFGSDTVVAITGVGSLFGLVKVKGIVDLLAKRVPGRLVVFFPGNYENNNYRLLDAHDGWGYLAVPITANN